jgi:PAS domain-containing protein
MANPEGRIVRANPRLTQMFGYERGERDGQALEALLPEWLRAAPATHWGGFFADPVCAPWGSVSSSPQGRARVLRRD